jgi:SpoVK/Ycf46/Vps4 family AAA+-type ATPase
MIFVGPPGAAKSAIAKSAGNQAGIPTVQLDLGAAKGSLVGQSEQQLRDALKVITAVSNGRSLWIATCNAIADLPPELRRRFTLGTFFFDLPDAEERAAIWEIYTRKYQIECFKTGKRKDSVQAVNPPPNDEGWTGAEIRQCCDIAWRLGCSLKEAAGFVVPVSKSAADKLEALRNQADCKFLSASQPGVYRKQVSPTKPETSARTLVLE